MMPSCASHGSRCTPRPAAFAAEWTSCGSISSVMSWRPKTSRGSWPQDPLSTDEAIGHIRSWLERPQVQILQPGSRHLELLESLMRASGVSGSLTTDVHLAALAIEHQAEVHSNDTDFSRFPGLRWSNPLR